MLARRLALALLLFSCLSAAPAISAQDACSATATAVAQPGPDGLAGLRTKVVDSIALVGKGDPAAAGALLKGLDASWDPAAAGCRPGVHASTKVVDRAIDRSLDRARFALRPHGPNKALGEQALDDLLAAIDEVARHPDGALL